MTPLCLEGNNIHRISNTDIKYNLNIVQAGFLRLAEMDHSDIQTSDISVVEQNAKVFWVFLLFFVFLIYDNNKTFNREEQHLNRYLM